MIKLGTGLLRRASKLNGISIRGAVAPALSLPEQQALLHSSSASPAVSGAGCKAKTRTLLKNVEKVCLKKLFRLDAGVVFQPLVFTIQKFW